MWHTYENHTAWHYRHTDITLFLVKKNQPIGSLGGLIFTVTPQNWFANIRVPPALSCHHSGWGRVFCKAQTPVLRNRQIFFIMDPAPPFILSFFHIDSYTTRLFFFLSTSPNSYERASLACTSHRCVMNLTCTVSTQDILIIPLSFPPSQSHPKKQRVIIINSPIVTWKTGLFLLKRRLWLRRGSFSARFIPAVCHGRWGLLEASSRELVLLSIQNPPCLPPDTQDHSAKTQISNSYIQINSNRLEHYC